MDNFVNLHGHSEKSLLDGMTRHNELVDYTLQVGQVASCITDHGNMFSIVDHFQYATSKGQKPIAGFEAYVVPDHTIKEKTEAQSETENKRQHLLLLAKNNIGYKKLLKICSVGMTEGFYYRPRIDDKVLANIGTEGIIGTSACLAGRIQQYLLRDDIEEAERQAIHYFKLFNGDFYLELQPTIEAQQVKVNKGLIELHKKLGIPVVCTTDFHYLRKEDAPTHDVLLAMQSRSLVSDPNRWRFPGDTFYVMTRQEIENAFKRNGHEVLDQDVIRQGLDNSVLIANQCNVEIQMDKHYLPKINPPADNDEFNKWSKSRKSDGNDSADYLRYLCIKGLKSKGKTSQEYRERLDYELRIINEMGFPDYFLIYWDIMKFCSDAKIPVGPARGCFTEDNPVNLFDGTQKSIKDMEIGDIVVGHDEQPHEVIDVLSYDCHEEILKLGIEDKSINGITKDHKIYAIKKIDFDKGIREPKWYKADELDIGDYIAELE